jgi:hypothetical protein
MWFYNQLKLGLTDRRLRVIVFNIITQKGKWKHTTGRVCCTVPVKQICEDQNTGLTLLLKPCTLWVATA